MTTFIDHLKEYVERGNAPAAMRRGVSVVEREFAGVELDLKEVSHHLLMHCQPDEIPVVLQTLTQCYQDWAIALLDKMDDQLHTCVRMNNMVLSRDHEWLLPGDAEFWRQLRNSFVALRGDIADFKEPEA